jgi:hypothetical protein
MKLYIFQVIDEEGKPTEPVVHVDESKAQEAMCELVEPTGFRGMRQWEDLDTFYDQFKDHLDTPQGNDFLFWTIEI